VNALTAFPLACALHGLELGAPMPLCLALYGLTLALEIGLLASVVVVAYALRR
jgi:hypothetical protein